MLKYLIFILVFNTICFAQDSDIYEISDRKSVNKLAFKRQIDDTSKDIIITNKAKPEIVLNKRENKDSKKALPLNENDKSANINTNNNSSEISKHEEIKDKNTKPEESKQSNASESETYKISNSKPKSISSTTGPNISNPKHAIEHPGATLRGFYVFLGLSILIIIYFVFKAFRLRPGAPPPTTVRKYGVVGRRSDMEMLPLPLAEEEDDDTLFDMGTQINR